MESLIIFVHVIAAIAITGLVLIQQGKGADMGASFGSGASQTLFGSSGSGNALTKSTSIMAVVFFITSLGLAIIARQQASLSVDDSGLIENLDEIAAALCVFILRRSLLAEDLPFVIEEALDDVPELATETAIEGDIPVVDGVPSEEVPE